MRSTPNRRGIGIRHQASLRSFVAASVLFGVPEAAHGESAILAGFSAGASIQDVDSPNASPNFRVGFGLDWLDRSGLTLMSRLESTHDIEATGAFLFGWAGEGLRSNLGLPLGLALGSTLSLDRQANVVGGGRALTWVGLWYSRATLELDATLTRPNRNWNITIGLMLRVVPWEPFRLQTGS